MLASPIAGLVVVAEFTVWVLLAMPLAETAVVGLAVAAGLFCVFTIGIGLALRRGVRVPCRCFGSPSPLAWHQVVRDGVLAVLAAVGAATWLEAGAVHVGGAVVAGPPVCCWGTW